MSIVCLRVYLFSEVTHVGDVAVSLVFVSKDFKIKPCFCFYSFVIKTCQSDLRATTKGWVKILLQ